MTKYTKEQFAAMLNGRQYGDELMSDDIKLALENDLIVCFGESSDILNARGRIESYACCSDCDFIYFIDNSVYNGSDARYPFDNYDYPSLRAFWSEDDDGWRYETDIPHATFKIFSGSELYCIGIVMDYKDIYLEKTNLPHAIHAQNTRNLYYYSGAKRSGRLHLFAPMRCQFRYSLSI